MGTTEAEEALRWLAAEDITPAGPGRWQVITAAGPGEHTDEDLAHEWADSVFHDVDLTPMQRVRVGVGLLEVMDSYWMALNLSWFLREEDDDPVLTAAFWAGVRRRLEAGEPSRALQIAMVTDYFPGYGPAEDAAFDELIGHELRALRAGHRLRELAGGPLHRRFARVLAASGPVRWAHKLDVYSAAAEVAELHPAVLDAVLHCYFDPYGDLEPGAALALLDRLDLPPDTEYLATLRAVLATGARRYHRDRALWDSLSPAPGVS